MAAASRPGVTVTRTSSLTPGSTCSSPTSHSAVNWPSQRVGDDERVARVQRPGLRRSQLDAGHRRVLALAHVDQVADLDPLVDPVVRPLAAAGDRQQGDGVVAGQRVGLGDRRPGRAAHAVEVEDQVADLHRAGPLRAADAEHAVGQPAEDEGEQRSVVVGVLDLGQHHRVVGPGQVVGAAAYGEVAGVDAGRQAHALGHVGRHDRRDRHARVDGQRPRQQHLAALVVHEPQLGARRRPAEVEGHGVVGRRPDVEQERAGGRGLAHQLERAVARSGRGTRRRRHPRGRGRARCGPGAGSRRGAACRPGR